MRQSLLLTIAAPAALVAAAKAYEYRVPPAGAVSILVGLHAFRRRRE